MKLVPKFANWIVLSFWINYRGTELKNEFKLNLNVKVSPSFYLTNNINSLNRAS